MYNLVELFEFLSVTFKLYYECCLLTVAHNRIDRYVSLRYKGLGEAKMNLNDICQSNVDYEVDSQNWTCTCTVRRTGYPTGEPCKH